MRFKTSVLIDLLVPIPPKPKQSARMGGGRVFTDPKHRKYVESIIAFVERNAPEVPYEGPFQLEITCYFPWRKSEPAKNKLFGWLFKKTKGDVDNYAKPIQDALEKAGWYKNDSEISRLIVTKVYRDCKQNEDGEFHLKLSSLEILQ